MQGELYVGDSVRIIGNTGRKIGSIKGHRGVGRDALGKRTATKPEHEFHEFEAEDSFSQCTYPKDNRPAPGDFKATNPKDRAATTRVDLSVFPDTALIHGALAMIEGDYKYGAYNFRTIGAQASVYIAAARRHLMKYWNGETFDPKTGVHHLGSAIACLAVLLDAEVCSTLNDDRPPKAPVANLLHNEEETVQRLQECFPNKPPRHREVGE